tara:strand:- start:2155 stop:2679 length:525 start_codon:yes stop_codon:yes gene_type:complete
MFQKILPKTQSTNGRVDILNKTPNMHNLFAMYDKIPAKQCATLRNPTEGGWENSPLSNTFFSAANIQILQNGIRAGVFRMSNKQYTIGEQPCDVLKEIMRSVFLQHAVNNFNPVHEQTAALNDFVINSCVQQLFGEVKGYLKYLQDASTLVVPMSPPTLVGAPDRRAYKMQIGL